MTFSACVVLRPENDRRRYWAKIIRNGTVLPLPKEVLGGDDLPSAYLREGDEEELFPGDVLFTGEARHLRRSHGYSYKAAIAGANGNPIWLDHDANIKGRLKQQGLARDLLPGPGDLAGLVRAVHAIRAGLKPYEEGSELQQAIDQVQVATQILPAPPAPAPARI
jgi:hypothetical protein